MFTITKSISVVCDETHGGIEAVETEDGYPYTIIIDAGATDTILISGVTIQGNLRAGQGGILMISGGALHVRNSTMYALGDCAVATRNATSVTIDNITSSNNFCGVGLAKASAGELNFALTNSRIVYSIRAGIYLGASSSMGAVKGVISNTVIDQTTSPSWGVGNHGIVVDASPQPVRLAVEDSIISGHKVGAFEVSGPGASVTVSGSSIVNNGVAITALNGATVATYGDNVLAGNLSNGAFTSSATKK